MYACGVRFPRIFLFGDKNLRGPRKAHKQVAMQTNNAKRWGDTQSIYWQRVNQVCAQAAKFGLVVPRRASSRTCTTRAMERLNEVARHNVGGTTEAEPNIVPEHLSYGRDSEHRHEAPLEEAQAANKDAVKLQR